VFARKPAAGARAIEPDDFAWDAPARFLVGYGMDRAGAMRGLPFIAAVALAVVERTQLNDFAYWRALDGRLGEILARRPARVAAPAPVPAVVKQTELVQ